MSGVGAVSQGLTRFAESESHFGIASGSRYIPRLWHLQGKCGLLYLYVPFGS